MFALPADQRSPEEFDRHSPLPLYYQLKQWLTAQIRAGELRPERQIPGEHELCRRFGVSRGVVRQALGELSYEGIINRQKGRGTFVASSKVPEGLMWGLRGLADDAAARNQQVDSAVLALREVPADETVALHLELSPGAAVVELERLRSIDGEPRVLVVSYLPAYLVPGLSGKDLAGTISLYRILRDEYRLPVVSGLRRVEATVADSRAARLLQIKRGDPLLVLRSIGYTTKRRPLDFFVAYHRGDRSAFEVHLPGPSAAASEFLEVLSSDLATAR